MRRRIISKVKTIVFEIFFKHFIFVMKKSLEKLTFRTRKKTPNRCSYHHQTDSVLTCKQSLSIVQPRSFPLKCVRAISQQPPSWRHTATCHLLRYMAPIGGASLHNAYLTFHPALPATRNQARGERKGVCPLPRQLLSARYLKLMAVIKTTLKVANGTFKY